MDGPNEFIIECPTFAAFYTLSWNDVDYERPALFTLRSLDNIPIAKSSRVRVFHGFGDTRIKVNGEIHQVKRECVVK